MEIMHDDKVRGSLASVVNPVLGDTCTFSSDKQTRNDIGHLFSSKFVDADVFSVVDPRCRDVKSA
jgi:hypothetical protein